MDPIFHRSYENLQMKHIEREIAKVKESITILNHMAVEHYKEIENIKKRERENTPGSTINTPRSPRKTDPGSTINTPRSPRKTDPTDNSDESDESDESKEATEVINKKSSKLRYIGYIASVLGAGVAMYLYTKPTAKK
jgi:hypothetical protein